MGIYILGKYSSTLNTSSSEDFCTLLDFIEWEEEIKCELSFKKKLLLHFQIINNENNKSS